MNIKRTIDNTERVSAELEVNVSLARRKLRETVEKINTQLTNRA